MILRKLFLALVLFVLASAPQMARADVMVSFYSHDFGSSFPHTFITIKGTLDRGDVVDANYGFTAKSVSPAILMGSVVGVVESSKPNYVASSDRQFGVKISDGDYDALMALVAKWRALPGKSYSLNKRNCIHFAGAAAELLGIKVVYDPKLMKKPKSFLLSLIALNPQLKGS
jgi:hypothetical protein